MEGKFTVEELATIIHAFVKYLRLLKVGQREGMCSKEFALQQVEYCLRVCEKLGIADAFVNSLE